jgi:hypothetical protein
MSNFDSITLEKGMYEAGNLSDVLESMDPSENYCGTTLQDLDAFSRQLKRFDIKVSGNSSDTVEKFFATSNSAVLFPEYVRRCVQIGIDENSVVQDLVANTIDANGMDYRSVYTESDNKQASLRMRTYHDLVTRRKCGRNLNTAYEPLRFQRISTLTKVLQQIGCYIAKCQLVAAVELLNDCECIGKHNIRSIITKFTKSLYAKNGYKLSTMICSSSELESLQKYLGSAITLKDNNYYCGDTKIIICPNMPYPVIVGMDNRFALEMVRFGPVHVDYERLIDKQFENTGIYSFFGYSLLCPDAAATMELSYYEG